MSFLLKIVEGPNKGAEIALVEGVAVTLGKSDECDIVLADSTLPDAPLSLEASADAVTAGGEPLEPLHVKTLGATSFAVGPADAPWGELVWPQPEKAADPEPKPEAPESAATDGRDNAGASRAASPAPAAESPAAPPPRRRRGCLGCLVALLIVGLILAVLGWFFRDSARPHVEKARPYAEKALSYAEKMWSKVGGGASSANALQVPAATLADVAAKYGLALSNEGGAAKLSGNFKTRRERLAATAEAYAAQPGVELDLSDDETFRAAADDALFTLTEGALKVVAATNRFLAICGGSPSGAALKNTLVALNADMPKLCGVDVSRVTFGNFAAGPDTKAPGSGEVAAAPRVSRLAPNKRSATRSFPVCGILTSPYPCLIARDGKRYLEGAALGDGVIVKIEPDSVVLTNSTGRFTWKP